MFKNLIIYRLDASWAGSAEQFEASLAAARFVECGPSQEKSIGWVEPRGQPGGPLLEVVAGQWLARLMIETRSLPASVVKRRLQERLAQIEASSGRKPGKKEIRDLTDDLRLELLPLAFTRQQAVWVWIDRAARWLVVDAASQARADEVATLLAQSPSQLALRLLDSRIAPAAAMTQWLLEQVAPAGFAIDRECELKAADASKAVVRYTHHRLDIEEVQQHIRSGLLPTRLALTWGERLSLVLTEGLQLKKLVFLDGVFEPNSARQSQDDNFDADVAIITGELQRLLPDLLQALGGEASLSPEPGQPG